jgi:predicted nucleic acid-binding protein
VRELLGGAELVLSSTLTLVECDRVMIRAVAVDGLAEAAAAERRVRLRTAVEQWILFDLDPEIVDRARRPFPKEPVRTLDAIHLATALLAQSLVPDLELLSLDDRVRDAAASMGLRLLPR